LVDTVVIMEEIGRALYDGPFLSSAVLATLAARALGAHDLLGELASGKRRGTVALEESGHGDPVARVAVTAEHDGDSVTLHGTKPLVIAGDSGDWVIVAARPAGGALVSFLVHQPTATPAQALDVTRRFASLHFDGTPATPIGPAGDHTDVWRAIADD